MPYVTALTGHPVGRNEVLSETGGYVRLGVQCSLDVPGSTGGVVDFGRHFKGVVSRKGRDVRGRKEVLGFSKKALGANPPSRIGFVVGKVDLFVSDPLGARDEWWGVGRI